MLAPDGHLLKSDLYNYNGFVEAPALPPLRPGEKRVLEQHEQDQISTAITKILRHNTAHPHWMAVNDLMKCIRHHGAQLPMQGLVEVLAGNPHFRIKTVLLADGKTKLTTVIQTEGPAPPKCPECVKEERCRGAAKEREKQQDRAQRRSGRRNMTVSVDYNDAFSVTCDSGEAVSVTHDVVDYSEAFPVTHDDMEAFHIIPAPANQDS